MNMWYQDTYVPQNIKKYMIDAFSDIETQTLDMETTTQNTVTIRKNLASIDTISNMAWVHLYTKQLINLADNIASNAEVTVNAGTKIYSGKDSVRIRYYLYRERNSELKMREMKLNAGSNIAFKEDIVVVWLVWEAYVEGKSFVNLSGNQIAMYLKKPLLPGSILTYKDIEIPLRNTYLTIKYYDGSEALVNFQETSYYQLYNLGRKQTKYLIRAGIENDYYYAKIRSFKNALFSTYSNQILLSPQNESDTTAPEISNVSSLKVPVYGQKIFDFIRVNFWK